MTLLPTVQHDLAAAAGRLDRRRTTRRRTVRLAVLAVLSLVALSGIAIAAGIVHWSPSGPGLRVTAAPPPAAQLAAFGVLRRPQRPSDRSAVALQAMRSSRPTANAPIRLGAARADTVRVLARHHGTTFVLVPRTYFVSDPGRPFKREARKDVLCLVAVEAAGMAGSGCPTTAEVVAGAVGASIGRTLYALVPDTVASVRVDGCEGRVVVPVRDNFVTIDRLPGWAGYGKLTWLDRAGRPIGTPAAGRSRCIRRTQ